MSRNCACLAAVEADFLALTAASFSSAPRFRAVITDKEFRYPARWSLGRYDYGFRNCITTKPQYEEVEYVSNSMPDLYTGMVLGEHSLQLGMFRPFDVLFLSLGTSPIVSFRVHIFIFLLPLVFDSFTLFASAGVVRFIVVLPRLTPAVFMGSLVCCLVLDRYIYNNLGHPSQDRFIHFRYSIQRRSRDRWFTASLLNSEIGHIVYDLSQDAVIMEACFGTIMASIVCEPAPSGRAAPYGKTTQDPLGYHPPYLPDNHGK